MSNLPMHPSRFALAVGPLLLMGCLTPRSMTYMTTAAPIGENATDVSVATGFGFQYQANPPTQTRNAENDIITSQTVTRGFALPNFEANLQHGVGKQLALNIHASSAGLQPGLKWTLTNSKKFAFALLPALGMGYGSVSGVTVVAGPDGRGVEQNPTTNTSFTFLTGLKAMFWHESGFYIGAGYDLMVNRSLNSVIVNSATSSDQTNTLTTAVSQNIGGAVGFEFKLGQVRLRPEIAVLFTPVVASTVSTRVANVETSASLPSGFGWAILPGLSVGVASPAQPSSQRDDDENEGNDSENSDEAAAEGETPKKDKYQDNSDEPTGRRRRGNEDELSPKPKKRDDVP